VDDIKDADAVAWGFYKPNTKPQMIYYKMNPLKDGDIRM